MADQQGNFLSKFVPRSHFFTDPDTITQTETQAFGPASADEFRVTSSFNIIASNANAYAICKGIVLVQPQAGSTDKVNLVLRPYTQPIQGVSIKYFIYRGLKLSDFFVGNLVKAAGAGSSDLINSLNAGFAAFHTSIGDGTIPEFLASYVGFNPGSQPDTLPLSAFFFKQSDYVESNGEFEETGDTAFELPTIALGATLGTFATGECGIDVVLNYGDYKLPVPNDEFTFNLAYARAAKTSISTATETDDFKKKVIREQIFQFLDVAAYFGFHAIDTGSVTLDVAGSKQVKKGQDIYDLMVSKFFSKNRLYLYIQSDRTRSYNFYENYNIAEDNDNCLKMGTTDVSVTERKYETSGWPLIINESSQPHDEDVNTLYLQLVTDNNVNTMLYGKVAQVANAQSNNFCGPDDLRKLDEFSEPRAFTKILTLTNPAVAANGNKVTVATFNIIVYQGVVYNYNAGQDTDGDGTGAIVFKPANNIDDIFDLINGEPMIKADANTAQSILSSVKTRLINYYKDGLQSGTVAVQTIVVLDQLKINSDDAGQTLNRVSYISEVVDVLNDAADTSGKVIINTSVSPATGASFTNDNVYALPYPYYYDTLLFTDGDNAITGLLLKTQDGSMASKIILGITQSENDLLKSIIADNESLNPRICFERSYLDDVDQLSAEGDAYQTYTIGIADEFDGQPRHLETTPEIVIYSLDELCYFSRGFADQIAMSVNGTVEKIYTL